MACLGAKPNGSILKHDPDRVVNFVGCVATIAACEAANGSQQEDGGD
jgi:hypothetical protein